MVVAADCARRYRGRGIATDDLDQVAYLGLVKAVRAFDPERGFDFLSFAVPTIRGELRRHFRDQGWALRPPRSIQELQTKILAVESDLAQELGRSPRPSDLARHLDVDLEQVLDALGATGCSARRPSTPRRTRRARRRSATGSGTLTVGSTTPTPG